MLQRKKIQQAKSPFQMPLCNLFSTRLLKNSKEKKNTNNQTQEVNFSVSSFFLGIRMLSINCFLGKNTNHKKFYTALLNSSCYIKSSKFARAQNIVVYLHRERQLVFHYLNTQCSLSIKPCFSWRILKCLNLPPLRTT